MENINQSKNNKMCGKEMERRNTDKSSKRGTVKSDKDIKREIQRDLWYSPNVQKAFNNFVHHCREKHLAEKQGRTPPKLNGPTKDTLEKYVKIAAKFGLFCWREHGVRRQAEWAPYFEEYILWLIDNNYSPWTVQSYVVAICFVMGYERPAIRLPVRHAALAQKGRRDLCTQEGWDALRDTAGTLFDVLTGIGIRHRENADLTGDCLVHDESGQLCVLVKKGKGGKMQLQHILAGYEDVVLAYFDGNPQKKVFHAEDIDRIPNIHIFRRIHALQAYREYERRLLTEPGYREALMEQVLARWRARNSKRKIPMRDLSGTYVIGGMNRKVAEFCGHQIEFDRLALMAVTVFDLSHWRINVAVNHYILPALREERGITDVAKILDQLDM